MNNLALGRIGLTIVVGWSLVASSLAQIPPSPATEPARKTTLPDATAEVFVLPKSVPEPLERKP